MLWIFGCVSGALENDFFHLQVNQIICSSRSFDITRDLHCFHFHTVPQGCYIFEGF